MKEKILEILKNSDSFISGEEISGILGISRAAVWKHINALKKQGYNIESVTKKGYRLKNSCEKILVGEIERNLTTEYIGRNIIFYENTDSTNRQAKLNNTEADGSVFIAENQNMGRGRLSREWASPPMSGIYMSLLLKPDISPASVSQITLVAGISVLQALGDYTEKDVFIKWPNDIVIGTKKVCGILTELAGEENRINYVVLGIGVNVNMKSFDEKIENKATSLFIEENKVFDRSEIIASILNAFEKNYNIFLESGFSALKEKYEKSCITLGKEVEIITPKKSYTAFSVGVDENGCLIVENDGKREIINSGEVSVRGLYGYV